ncbi:MAG: lipase family protein [Bacteroidetes bacterium]|nr:MAG: lipase family protein [Bacteroidota bacterium]
MKIILRNTGLLVMLLLISGLNSYAQNVLKPGFDPGEYAELLGLTHNISSTNNDKLSVPVPGNYKRVYQSKAGPLDNLFDLYLRDDGVGVLEIRGTTAKTSSWLENFYAGMVPATGVIQISLNEKFHYKLSDDSLASVHSGWLTGLACMAEDIVDKINEYHRKGVKEFILMGHSQGGAIVFLLNSYLYYDLNDLVPDDIIFKTYNSAAPKPGNLFYAYDYDYINRGGWAIRVVNPVDWVPQTPITVQVLDDFSEVNPFVDMETFTGSMGWMEKVVVKSIFRKTDRSLDKARKRLLKYLGVKMFKFIDTYMDGMQEPEYAQSMNYVPAGTPVILPPTEKYYKEFIPNTRDNVFKHHFGKAYYFLLKEHYDLDK